MVPFKVMLRKVFMLNVEDDTIQLIVMLYSVREMFVTHNIPLFYELLCKCVYRFSERKSHSANKIIKVFIARRIYPLPNSTMVGISIVFILILFFSMVIIIYILTFSILYKRLSEIIHYIIYSLFYISLMFTSLS